MRAISWATTGFLCCIACSSAPTDEGALPVLSPAGAMPTSMPTSMPTAMGGVAGDVPPMQPAGGGPVAPDGLTPVNGSGTAAPPVVDAAMPNAGPDATTEDPSPTPQRAVTADFLNGTLSVVDVDLMTEGSTRADALIGTVDLSSYLPGPMSLNITPDGKTVVVSISSGFLSAFISTPPGAGTLVFVDLESLSVTGELYVGDSPMGIVFSPDSSKAYVGLYAERYFAVVDLASRTFDEVATGSSYNEELSIDDSGEVGIITYGPAGNARTFALDDPAGTLGATAGLSGDAAGVAFFPGTKKAYLMQAPTILTGNVGGHDIVDVSNPASPTTHGGDRIGSHPTTYPVTSVHARGSIAFPSTEDGVVSVVEVGLQGNEASEVQRVVVGDAESLAYGITATRDGRVLIAVPGEHYIGVVDLEAGTAYGVPWEMTMTGPTEIKAVP